MGNSKKTSMYKNSPRVDRRFAMKYIKEECLHIGRRIYEGGIETLSDCEGIWYQQSDSSELYVALLRCKPTSCKVSSKNQAIRTRFFPIYSYPRCGSMARCNILSETWQSFVSKTSITLFMDLWDNEIVSHSPSFKHENRMTYINELKNLTEKRSMIILFSSTNTVLLIPLVIWLQSRVVNLIQTNP